MMAGFAKPPKAKEKPVKAPPPADLTGLRKHDLGEGTKVGRGASRPSLARPRARAARLRPPACVSTCRYICTCRRTTRHPILHGVCFS